MKIEARRDPYIPTAHYIRFTYFYFVRLKIRVQINHFGTFVCSNENARSSPSIFKISDQNLIVVSYSKIVVISVRVHDAYHG